jgi:hypothetical protein
LAERFFFDLTDGPSTIHDEDGALATDLDEAIMQAEEVLTELRATGELSDAHYEWMMIIRGAGGGALMRLPVVPAGDGAIES